MSSSRLPRAWLQPTASADHAAWMQTYQVRTGRRKLALVEAATAQQALLDYARSMGCHDTSS